MLKIRSALPAVLSAALLFCTAAPAQAVELVGAGHGSYLAANQQDVLRFSFFVSEGGNGSVRGYAVWRGPNSVTVSQVTSFAFTDDGALAFAGPVIGIFGTPPPGFAVGRQAFSAFKDNGWFGFPAQDQTASISVLPPEFGNPPIQFILAALGPPPLRPLLNGNVWIP